MTPDPIPPDDANVVDPLVLAERRVQRAELAEQVAGRRAADAQALAAELSAERARLEAELEQARREPERLSRLVAERERALRAAEQRAHAEEAQRIEAIDELATRTRDHEAQLASLRAELARATAEAARERGELEARAADAEAAAGRELEARVAQAGAEAARERAELETRLARAETEAQRAERDAAERLAELQRRVEAAEADATRRGGELEALRAQLDDAERAAAAAESARKRAEAKRVAARDKRRRALEARDAALAEAQAARAGADAAMAEAAHAQAERATLRAALEQARAERDGLRGEVEQARAERDGLRGEVEQARAERDRLRGQAGPQGSWSERLRRELALARAVGGVRLGASAGGDGPLGAAADADATDLGGAGGASDAGAPGGATPAAAHAARVGGEDPSATGPGPSALERERRLIAQRDLRGRPAQPRGVTVSGRPLPAAGRGPERAMPVTALALERERSVRLQAQLDRRAETERDLRAQVAALQEAVAARVEAEARIEAALRRVRGELEAANALQVLSARQAPPRPTASAAEPAPDAPPPPSGFAGRPVAGERSEAGAPAAGAPAAAERSEGDAPTAGAPTAGERSGGEAPPAGAPTAAERSEAGAPAAGASTAGELSEGAAPAAGGAPTAAEIAAALDAARAERLAAARAEAERAGRPDAPEAADPGAAATVQGRRPDVPVSPSADPTAPAQRDRSGPPEVSDRPDPGAPETERWSRPDLAEPGAAAAERPLVLDRDPLPLTSAPSSLDRDRLTAARARLRAGAPAADGPLAPSHAPAAPAGPPAPWLPAALRRLVADDPDAVGRILVGMLPALGLVTDRAFACDLVLADRGTVALDVAGGAVTVRATERPRPRRQLDLEIATTHAGLGRLLAGRRGLRRRARVRGTRRRMRELRRLAREPLALRDLANAGAVLEPALALRLAALAIDPASTRSHRFTIAHAPLPGGPPDAWLRIRHGDAPTVLRTRPGEEPAATLRCTRGALLALLAGVAPPPGEGAAVDGDARALELVRGWIARTEFSGR